MNETPKRQKRGEFLFGGVAFALGAIYCLWRAFAYGGMYVRKGLTWWLPKEQVIVLAVVQIPFSIWCLWLAFRKAPRQNQRKKNDHTDGVQPGTEGDE